MGTRTTVYTRPESPGQLYSLSAFILTRFETNLIYQVNLNFSASPCIPSLSDKRTLPLPLPFLPQSLSP